MHEAKETKIFDAKVFLSAQGTGVAVMTTCHRVFVVTDIRQSHRAKRLVEIPSRGTFLTWAIYEAERFTRIFVSMQDGLYRLDFIESIHMAALQTDVPELRVNIASTVAMLSAFLEVDGRPHNIDGVDDSRIITDISISVNGENGALYFDSGHLWMGSSDFTKKFALVPIDIPGKPKQMAW
ncbi:unnamed protein product [Darwinula stevensoni]|uniref:Vps16 N-terminal domain-containing protein n=1 Tax=Darwinula stevensoni TaxID=69355 RepID=A0A7R8X9N6_9CRUS|nr:unnamed protein product [Darwinula stevensoni]CAG0889322.1 unnamed protein product [Darwinula stevensoni]